MLSSPRARFFVEDGGVRSIGDRSILRAGVLVLLVSTRRDMLARSYLLLVGQCQWEMVARWMLAEYSVDCVVQTCLKECRCRWKLAGEKSVVCARKRKDACTCMCVQTRSTIRASPGGRDLAGHRD